ncbi:MAG: diguanylate cyclase [Nitrospirales bacterium]
MIRILLVEDNPVDAQLAQDSLDEWGAGKFEVEHVDTLAEALRRLSRQRFDAVLLDLSLPDAKGVDTVTYVLRTSPGVPIVVLSGWGDDDVGVQAVQKGAQDFLVKGMVNGALISRAVRFAIERKRAEERLSYLAHHDPLTGLANRGLFYDRLQQALARSKRVSQLVGVMLLDLDRFKVVNDTLGHECGDRVLQETAARLVKCVREVDTVCRIGGDEFTVLVEGVAREQDLSTVARRILEAMSRPFVLDTQEITVGVSVGITAFPLDNQAMEDLLKHADAAMYRAKERGGQCYHFYVSREGEPALVSSASSP